MLELLGAVVGAIAGATIAQSLGANDQIVTGAIAGSFIGGALAPAVRRALVPREPPRE